MKSSIIVKKFLASMFHRTGVASWKLNRISKTNIAILMYHRIIPTLKSGSDVQSGMVVEPDTLDSHLEYLNKYFDIVPISKLKLIENACVNVYREKPYCVLTFDDGWQDFYKYAYPILKKYEVSATVFLPTDYIGTDRWFWTDRIAILLRRISETRNGMECISHIEKIPLPLRTLVNYKGTYVKSLERVIAYLKTLRIEEIEKILNDLSEAFGINVTPIGRAFLNWEEVKEMYESGLVTYGSHTASHPLLTTLSEEQIRDELITSMNALISNKVVDKGFITFSYPNGNYSERISNMVSEAGYHLAVTTKFGWNQQGADRYTLKRISLHQDMTSTKAMLESRIVNLL
jgi:peptidoglycan/xylan/chitin deacetylase (PgdA/CDA1 family)